MPDSKDNADHLVHPEGSKLYYRAFAVAGDAIVLASEDPNALLNFHDSLIPDRSGSDEILHHAGMTVVFHVADMAASICDARNVADQVHAVDRVYNKRSRKEFLNALQEAGIQFPLTSGFVRAAAVFAIGFIGAGIGMMAASPGLAFLCINAAAGVATMAAISSIKILRETREIYADKAMGGQRITEPGTVIVRQKYLGLRESKPLILSSSGKEAEQIQPPSTASRYQQEREMRESMDRPKPDTTDTARPAARTPSTPRQSPRFGRE